MKKKKSESAMIHKNKTKKYSVAKTCVMLKSRLEKDTISPGPK